MTTLPSKIFRVSLSALLIAGITGQAAAGPFIDRLKERRAARQEQAESKGESSGLEDSDGEVNTSPLPSGVRLLKDVSYGTSQKQKMDVYLPPNAVDAPVVLMVHGGGWKRGDKAMEKVVNNKVARWVQQGIIVVSINYRLLPEADPLTQADDAGHALAAAQSKAASWGGSPSKFILAGHSAGAHLVSLLSASPNKAYNAGAKPWLGTISLDSAAMNVVETMEKRHYRLYDNAFGTDRSYWEKASPYHALTASSLPILLVCSTKRPDAPCKQAYSFSQKANGMGLRTQVLEEALSHGEINGNLGLPDAYTNEVEAFMRTLDPSLAKLLSSQ